MEYYRATVPLALGFYARSPENAKAFVDAYLTSVLAFIDTLYENMDEDAHELAVDGCALSYNVNDIVVAKAEE